MIEAEKERMIALLIESFDEYGDAEGIYGVHGKPLIELLQLLAKYGHKTKEREDHIKWLVKNYGEEWGLNK